MGWLKGKVPWMRAIVVLAIEGGIAWDWQQQGIVSLLGVVGPFVYGTLGTFFALLAPLVSWELWPANRRSAQLGGLSEEILTLRDQANTAELGGNVYPAINTLNAKLEKLEIQIPNMDLRQMNGRMSLVMLLSTLGGYAETRNLKAAKGMDMNMYQGIGEGGDG